MQERLPTYGIGTVLFLEDYLITKEKMDIQCSKENITIYAMHGQQNLKELIVIFSKIE